MRREERDRARLWDMLDAARAISGFVKGRDLERFLADRMLRNAVERNLEIIGEAARRVSPETRQELEAIPWRAIIALRNVLAHEYGEIQYDRLWTVCRVELPLLIESLDAMGLDGPPDDACL